MRHLLLFLGLVLAVSAYADNAPLPPEVAAFIKDRDACDHFRGEPYDNSPGQTARREFIFESLEIYCSGTDRRLAALKKRYKNDEEALRHLNGYEEKIEGGVAIQSPPKVQKLR